MSITRRLFLALGSFVLLGAFMSSCSDDAEVLSGPGASTTGGAGSSAFDGRTYLSTEVVGHTLVDGTKIRLSFDGPTLSRNSGCNTTGSGYTLTDDRLRVVDDGFSTTMGCEADLEAQDQWLEEFLASGPNYSSGEDELRLTSGEVTVVLTADDTDAAPLIGTSWSLESITEGGAVTSVPAGVEVPTILIGEDAMAEIFTGCNTGGAAVGTSPSSGGQESLHFGGLRTTKMACDEAAMELEAAVLAVLDSGPAFTIEGDRLELTGGDDVTLIYRAG